MNAIKLFALCIRKKKIVYRFGKDRIFFLSSWDYYYLWSSVFTKRNGRLTSQVGEMIIR